MKKEILKKFWPYAPEASILLLAVVGFFEELLSRATVNYFTMVCIAIMLILIIWKNKYFALVLSVLLGLVSFYMLLAVVSEFREFASGDAKGMQLLLTGSLLFGFLMLMSFLIPGKYFSKNSGY